MFRCPKTGTLLPAGALACVWIYGLHRHPALWESPNTFLPGRWLGAAAARQVSRLQYTLSWSRQTTKPASSANHPSLSHSEHLLTTRIHVASVFTTTPRPSHSHFFPFTPAFSLRPTSNHLQPAGAFIPYASGPRGCVGRPFAGVALRIMLARLCLALDFSPADTVAADTAAAATGADIVTGCDNNPVPAEVFPSITGGPKVGAGLGSEEVPGPPSKRDVCHHEGGIRGKEEEGCAENQSFCKERDVLLNGRRSLGGSCRESPGAGQAGGGNKEMQAGFTVLPAGGVHLRLQKWED